MIKLRNMGTGWALLDALQQICEENNISSYLEIGVSVGNSLAQTVTAARKSLKRLCLCDTWGKTYGGIGHDGHAHIAARLRTLDYHGKVTFLDGDSRVLIPTVRETFDLINVDGDHSPEGALIDLVNVWPLLVPGGFLVFDDIVHPCHRDLLPVFEQFAMETGCPWVTRLDTPHGVGVIRRVR